MYTLRVKFVRRFFPKRKPQPDDWQVTRVEIVEQLDREPRLPREITLVGEMLCMDDSAIYEVMTEKTIHEKYGENFEVKSMREVRDFKTNRQKKEFLSIFLNDKQIQTLYELADNPIDLLENKDITTLTKAKGIGEKTAQKMIDRYYECKDYGVVYQKMITQYGLTMTMINKIIKHFKDSPDLALAKLESNPYNMTEVEGIGFLKADEIALNSGVDKLDSRRVRAYILYYLEEIGNSNGHSYAYYDEIVDNVEEYLGQGIHQDLVDETIQELIDEKKLYFRDTEDSLIIALRKVFETEKSINHHLRRLIKGDNNIDLDESEIDRLLVPQETKQGWSFTERQKQGIKEIIRHNVVVIRGYGGTGKSSTVAGVLSCLDEFYTFKQCALSGKASVNLRDITGQDGSTIHTLLGYIPKQGFKHNEENPLQTNMVILDEASMPDIYLFNALIKAIPTGAKLILLGDTNQLEAIGVGNILFDIIDSEQIPVVTFDEIHRQSAKSGIIPFSIEIAKGMTRFKDGWYGEQTLGDLQDLTVIGYQYKKDVDVPRPTLEHVLESFRKLYKECKGDISQIAVISPTKVGNAGCNTINKLIQDYVLPSENRRGDFIEVNGVRIYKGDKVINTKNNYEVVPNIFNGNMGEVISVDSNESRLVIDFYNIGEVVIDGKALDSIELGYAITTHKSQGSTIPYVVSCIDYSHFVMLNRQQVYTMITRAKKKEIFIFETRALNRAIKTNNVVTKRTFLYFFLTDEL